MRVPVVPLSCALVLALSGGCGKDEPAPQNPSSGGPAGEAPAPGGEQGGASAAAPSGTKAAGSVDPVLAKMGDLMGEPYGYTIVVHPKRMERAFGDLSGLLGNLIDPRVAQRPPLETLMATVLGTDAELPATLDLERPMAAGLMRVLGDRLDDFAYGAVPSMHAPPLALHHRLLLPATDAAALSQWLAAQMGAWGLGSIEGRAAWKLDPAAKAFGSDGLLVVVTAGSDLVRVDLVMPGVSSSDEDIASALSLGAPGPMTPGRHHLLEGHGYAAIRIDTAAAARAAVALGIGEVFRMMPLVPADKRFEALTKSLSIVAMVPVVVGFHDLEISETTLSLAVDKDQAVDLRATTTFSPEFAAKRASDAPAGRTWSTHAERPLLAYHDTRHARVSRPVEVATSLDRLARTLSEVGAQGQLLQRLGNPTRQLHSMAAAALGPRLDKDRDKALEQLRRVMPWAVSVNVDRVQLGGDKLTLVGAVALDMDAGSELAMTLVQEAAAGLEEALPGTPVAVTQSKDGDRRRVVVTFGDAKLADTPREADQDSVDLHVDPARLADLARQASPELAAGLSRIVAISGTSRTQGLVSGHRLRLALSDEVAKTPVEAVIPLAGYAPAARPPSKGLDCLSELPGIFAHSDVWNVAPDKRQELLAKQTAQVRERLACAKADPAAKEVAARVARSRALHMAELAALAGQEAQAHASALGLCEQKVPGACELVAATKPIAPAGTLALATLGWPRLLAPDDGVRVTLSTEGVYYGRERLGDLGDEKVWSAMAARAAKDAELLERTPEFNVEADAKTTATRLVAMMKALGSAGDPPRISLVVETPEGRRSFRGLAVPPDKASEADAPAPSDEDEEPEVEPERIDPRKVGLNDLLATNELGGMLETRFAAPTVQLRFLPETLELSHPGQKGPTLVARGAEETLALARAGQALAKALPRERSVALVASPTTTWGEVARTMAALSVAPDADLSTPEALERALSEAPRYGRFDRDAPPRNMVGVLYLGVGPSVAAKPPETEDKTEEEGEEVEEGERASAELKIGAGKSTGFCKKSNIKSVVRRRAGAFRACYERRLKVKPRLAGQLDVRWTIGIDGRVKGASASGSLGDPQVKDCVLRVFRRMRFKKPDGGICVVKWPLRFEPG